jgi:hypothetical protein
VFVLGPRGAFLMQQRQDLYQWPQLWYFILSTLHMADDVSWTCVEAFMMVGSGKGRR